MTITQIILSIITLLAGGAKLFGAKPLADQFEEFGLPKKLMYVVGSLEIAAAIGIQIKFLSFYAALGLVFLMLGAIVNHIKIKHGFKMIYPSLLVLSLSALNIYFTYSTANDILNIISK